jgi:predicted HAD superfamily hydrolase
MKRKINTAQKNNSKRRDPKSNKTIINWSEYNKALAARGNISVYISEAIALRKHSANLAKHIKRVIRKCIERA